MNTVKKIYITQDLLDDLEKTGGLKDLKNQQDFEDVLKMDSVIIYLFVDWSGPEILSRYYVYRALNELDKEGIPIFKFDCTDQNKMKHVEDWLTGQRESKQHFYFGGWGETVFVEKGEIIDFIANPGQLGLDLTIEKIKKWKNTTVNNGDRNVK